MAWNYEFPYRKLRALQDGIRVLWLPQEPVNGAQKSPHCRRLVVLAVLPLHIHNEASHMYIQLSWVEVLKVSPTCRTSCRKSRDKDTLLSVFFVFSFSCTWTKLKQVLVWNPGKTHVKRITTNSHRYFNTICCLSPSIHAFAGAWKKYSQCRKVGQHAQIAATSIFTSEQQPWISISHHPVFTAQRVRNEYSITSSWLLCMDNTIFKAINRNQC